MEGGEPEGGGVILEQTLLFQDINFCSKPLLTVAKERGRCRRGVSPLPAACEFDFVISNEIQYIPDTKNKEIKKAPASGQVQKGCRLQLHYLIHLYRL